MSLYYHPKLPQYIDGWGNGMREIGFCCHASKVNFKGEAALRPVVIAESLNVDAFDGHVGNVSASSAACVGERPTVLGCGMG